MIDFIAWVAFIGVMLCALVFIAIIVVLFLLTSDWYHRRRMKREVLPYPDVSAERMYDIQYFYRANGRTDK